MTSPAVFFWFHDHDGWGVFKSIAVTAALVVVFRGMTDLLVRRIIPWPSLFGTEDMRLREEDITNRRRAWTWRSMFRKAVWIGGIITIVWLIQYILAKPGANVTWVGTLEAAPHPHPQLPQEPAERAARRSAAAPVLRRTS